MKSTNASRSLFRRRAGFTLLEILASIAMFSLIVGALYSVFFSTLRLRTASHEAVKDGQSMVFVADLIARDLANMAPPVGVFAGPVVGEKHSDGSRRLDRIEFYSSSGVVDDDEPWGEVQWVSFFLQDPDEPGETEGRELVRSVTRNLLPVIEEEPKERRLLSDVDSLEFAYYDGEVWQESWDSTAQENETPLAVRVRIDFAPLDEGGAPVRAPMELVVVVASQGPEESEEGGSG